VKSPLENFAALTVTIWSRNVTTSTREPTTCAWIRVDKCRQDGAICSKNSKFVPYHRCAWIPRLAVSVPDYGSWLMAKFVTRARLVLLEHQVKNVKNCWRQCILNLVFRDICMTRWHTVIWKWLHNIFQFDITTLACASVIHCNTLLSFQGTFTMIFNKAGPLLKIVVSFGFLLFKL